MDTIVDHGGLGEPRTFVLVTEDGKTKLDREEETR